MGRNAVVGILVIALAALAGLQVVTFRRLQRLQEQIASAPRERPVARAEHRAASPEALAAEPGTPAAAVETSAPLAAPDSEGRPARVSAARQGPLTAEQVEDIVKRAMKERDEKSPLRAVFDMGNLEDPLAVMERELQLSPSQKLRIQEHMKAREEQYEALWKDGANVDPKKWQEIDENHEASVKRELDYAQQQKYDDLKKSGKLLGGGAVVWSKVELHEAK